MVEKNLLNSMISDFSASNTQDWNGISYNMLKNSSDNILNIITDFHNLILQYNIIPSKLNISLIKPIPKDHSKTMFDLSNLRPISVFNCLGLIIEKISLKSKPYVDKNCANQFCLQNEL
jgi:hypothetical protein